MAQFGEPHIPDSGYYYSFVLPDGQTVYVPGAKDRLHVPTVLPMRDQNYRTI